MLDGHADSSASGRRATTRHSANAVALDELAAVGGLAQPKDRAAHPRREVERSRQVQRGEAIWMGAKRRVLARALLSGPRAAQGSAGRAGGRRERAVGGRRAAVGRLRGARATALARARIGPVCHAAAAGSLTLTLTLTLTRARMPRSSCLQAARVASKCPLQAPG